MNSFFFERWPKTGTPDALLAKIGYHVFSKSGEPPGRHLIGSRPPAPFLGQYPPGCTRFWLLTPPRVPDPQRSLPVFGRTTRLQQPAHTSACAGTTRGPPRDQACSVRPGGAFLSEICCACTSRRRAELLLRVWVSSFFMWPRHRCRRSAVHTSTLDTHNNTHSPRDTYFNARSKMACNAQHPLEVDASFVGRKAHGAARLMDVDTCLTRRICVSIYRCWVYTRNEQIRTLKKLRSRG